MLDLVKMVPSLEAVLERGGSLFLTTCNPATVRDEVVAHPVVFAGGSMADLTAPLGRGAA